MRDAAAFFRQRAPACFHRRHRWPFLSADWRREVDDTRRFIRGFRTDWESRAPEDRRATEFVRSAWALGPRVGEDRRLATESASTTAQRYDEPSP